MANIIAVANRGGPLVCDDPAPIKDFDAARYMGMWYDMQYTANPFQPHIESCSTTEFGNYDAETSGFNIHQSGTISKFPRISATGTGTFTEGGHANIDFFTMEPVDYRIIATDYESYSMVYSCNPEAITANLTIYSRDPLIDEVSFDLVKIHAAEFLPNYTWTASRQDMQDAACVYGESVF